MTRLRITKDTITPTLNRFQKLAKDWEQIHKLVGKEVQITVNEGFATETDPVSGKKWVDKIVDEGTMNLEGAGVLWADAIAPRNYTINANTLEIFPIDGTNHPGAETHQEGLTIPIFGTMMYPFPQRRFIGINDETNVRISSRVHKLFGIKE